MTLTETWIEGPDVSHWNGKVDWPEVAAAGYRFAIAKASEVRPDERFADHWAGIKKAGMKRGCYHYFRPSLDAKAQARMVLGLIPDWTPEDFPPALDVERRDGRPTGEVLAGILEWMAVVSAQLGCRPWIYTGTPFWQSEMKGSAALADYPLWIAHYTSHTLPAIPPAWKKFTRWQYTSNATVPGITRPVDLNRGRSEIIISPQNPGV